MYYNEYVTELFKDRFLGSVPLKEKYGLLKEYDF